MRYLYLVIAVICLCFASFSYGLRVATNIERLQASFTASEAQDSMCSDCYHKGYEKAKKDLEKLYGDDTAAQAERY